MNKQNKNVNQQIDFSYDDLHYACTTFYSHKWQLSILVMLSTGPKNFGEILKQHPGLSKKVLSANLHKMRTKGVVDRQEYHKGDVLMTRYSLTKPGRELFAILESLADWGSKYAPEKPREEEE